MSYVDNASLITAWDTRVQALKDKINTLYDGTSHNVLIEDTTSAANVLLGSVDGLTLDSNEQAPTVTPEAPALVVEPTEEDEVTEEVTEEETEEEETVEETDETEEEE